MIVWSGAGMHGFVLACYVVWSIIGMDPDQSRSKFFLVLAPTLVFTGFIINIVTNHLTMLWTKEHHQTGIGYKLNRIFTFLKCDLSAPATEFYIPLPYLSLVSLLLSLLCWSGIFE
jgi:hypothetical protein